MKQEHRESNIELLRIIAMILIIAFHFAIHGSFDYKTTGITISCLWYNFILMGGKVDVDIFVLIFYRTFFKVYKLS